MKLFKGEARVRVKGYRNKRTGKWVKDYQKKVEDNFTTVRIFQSTKLLLDEIAKLKCEENKALYKKLKLRGMDTKVRSTTGIISHLAISFILDRNRQDILDELEKKFI